MSMADDHNDPTTSEDHFGRHDFRKSNVRMSVLVIALIVVIVLAVYFFKSR